MEAKKLLNRSGNQDEVADGEEDLEHGLEDPFAPFVTRFEVPLQPFIPLPVLLFIVVLPFDSNAAEEGLLRLFCW